MLLPILLTLALQAPLNAASPELRIPYDEFRKLYDSGNVLVLDVRGDASYQAGHIPGAISLPLDRVDAKIPELKKETRPIVTYCS